MNKLTRKIQSANRRAYRVRSRVAGTEERPRLAVHVSNRHIMAQIINDDKGKTLVYVSTVGKKVSGPMTAQAAGLGTEIAQKALKAKIKKVVFDRSSKKYHGRIKALADAAREAGLEF